MKLLSWQVVVGGLVLLAPTQGQAQVEAARSQEEDRTSYSVDAISFARETRSKSRLDVFVQVGYEVLSFVKQGNQYVASYDMTIAIYDSASKLVSEKVWTEPITVATFDQSVSSGAYSLTQRVFDVEPGRYYVSTILRDNETKASKRLLRQISVPDYSLTPVSFSDIMLINRLTQVGEKMNIVPSVSANVGDIAEPFHLFFEAYSASTLDSVKVEARVFDEKKELKLTADTTYTLRAGKTQIFMTINHLSLPVGDYSILVNAYTAEQARAEEPVSLASTSRAFFVRWSGLPKTIRDLDLAIDQVQYIAKDSEVSRMKEAPTAEEKQRRFLEFWKVRDPNPNTPRNEKMEKYYERVEYANKHFTHYIDGWRTDMGMVFIMFGAPDNVDRHPFDIDAKPYEVWSYYQLNYSFVFVDQTGFGDYRLTTPIWEVWQRPAE